MRIHKILATLVGATVVGAALAPSAMAADTTDVSVLGGSLSITNPLVPNFTSVTLDGTAKTTNATMDNFSVTDARGTGAGWNVTVQATQFCELDALLGVCAVGGKTLPASSLKLAQPTVSADGTTSPSPTVTSAASGYTIDAGSAVKIASAAADTGMGKYDFALGNNNMTLSIPASAYAKTYRSTVTVSVVSGP